MKRDHGDGGIDQRSQDRWRLRWRVGGKRYTKTFQGSKRAVQTELRRLLKTADDGVHVTPDKTAHIERSLEETEGGRLRFKPPKTKYGRRTISLPANVVEILRSHRRQQAELRMSLGLGRLGAEDLVFPLPDGAPYPPDTLSRDWGNVVRDRKLPRVMFHALRHSHASALIAAGLDVVTISRRLGHGSPAITLSVYAHAFGETDRATAQAIDAVMGR